MRLNRISSIANKHIHYKGMPRTRITITSVPLAAEGSQLVPMASRTSTPPMSPSNISPRSDVMLLPLNDSPKGSEDNAGRGNFGRFAFTGSRPSVRDPPSGRGSSHKEPSFKALPNGKMVTKHQFSADFSDAELAKLDKCVSCNVRWTMRKTAAQKIKHVQSCAKKHSFNDETIRFLIRKDIESVMGDVSRTTDKKGKGKASVRSVQSPTPKTFYEHVVTDAAPKKKGRRVEAGETVRSVASTRNAILGRARVVLDSIPSESRTELGSDLPVYLPTCSAGNGLPMPSTQPFGKSALALKHRKEIHDIVDSSSSSSDEERSSLLAIQALTPSNFGGAQPSNLGGQASQALPPSHFPSTNPINVGCTHLLSECG